MRRGVLDVEARSIAELNRLLRQRKGPGNECLRGDDCGGGREAHEREERPGGREQEERLLGGVAIDEQQRALTKVIQDQRGQHERIPGNADGPLTEVPHIRIQRFTPGDGQEDGTEHRDAGESVRTEIPDGVHRINGADDGGLAHDPDDAKTGDRDEPDHHDRTEQTAHPVRPVLLEHEQRDQDDHGNRNHIRREERRRHPKTLNGAEHADRGCDDAVAVEQRRPEDPEQYQNGSHRSECVLPPGRDERRQREDAALALVVRAHHDRDVFDRDDDEERVQHHREHAEDVLGRNRDAVRAVETLADGVQRAGADVAVHDTERSQREGQQPLRSGRARAPVAHEIVALPNAS